jgi:hypothetical protein
MEFANESYKKKKIPKAVAEQVWISFMGHKFEGKCRVSWCKNRINVFNYECGHNVPESKGGKTTLDNLASHLRSVLIAVSSDNYTIDEWTRRFAPPQRSWWSCLFKKGA